MSGQWGRGGGGTSGQGIGLGGVIFAAIVSLAIGSAAGYGVFRTMDSHSGSAEVARFEERLEALTKERDAATAARTESDLKAEELAAANASSRSQIQSLRETVDALEAAAKSEARPPTQDSSQASRTEIRALERKLADAEAFRRRAEEAVLERDRLLSIHADEVARLEKELAAGQSADNAGNAEQQAEIDRLKAETARLQAETTRLQGEAEELRKAAETASAELELAKTIEIPNLTRQLEEKTRDLEATAGDLATKTQELETKIQELSEASELNRSLTARIAALEEEATRAVAVEEPETDLPATGNADPQATDNAEPEDSRSPRNATLVTLALQATPGLDRLSEEQRSQLERTLLSGECVTNALGAVFSRVPVLTLRNLMRDLDSDC